MKIYWKYRIRRILEIFRYLFCFPAKKNYFLIISSERNAGIYAVKCLESIFRQNYDKILYKHIFIDDNSDDNTDKLISKWLSENPQANVRYIRNSKRLGLCENNIRGFSMAKKGEIVLEVNGDDWLPDKNVLSFLNKIYSDKNIWMTYNTYFFSNNTIGACKKISDKIIANNDFRNLENFFASHLHSFRSELFYHINKESLIDPDTDKYWESAVDKAVYLPLFELAGKHSKHIFRKMYIYNLRDISHENVELDMTRERANRISSLEKFLPLETLEMPDNHNWIDEVNS